MKNLFPVLLILFISNTSCKEAEPEPAVANFTFTLLEDGKVSFKNISTNADQYEWDFGNGTKSKELNPVAIYEKNGEYSVVLIVKASKSQNTKIGLL